VIRTYVKVYDLKQNSRGEHKHFCRKICHTRFFNNSVVAASDTRKIHIMDKNAEEFSSDDNTTRMRKSLVIPKVQDLFTFTSKILPHDTLNWKFPFKTLILLSSVKISLSVLDMATFAITTFELNVDQSSATWIKAEPSTQLQNTTESFMSAQRLVDSLHTIAKVAKP
jgi:hypothetical protein